MTRKANLLAAAVLLLGAGGVLAQGRPQPSPLAYAPPPPPPPPSPLAEPPPPTVAEVATNFYVSVDLAFLKPTITGNLSNQMPLGARSQTINVPRVDLDWTVSPTIEFGYRLSPCEMVVFSYRFLAAESTGQVIQPDDRVTQLRTRLDVQVFDLDYLLTARDMDVRLPANYELTARIGARLADVFFDSQATDAAGLRQASNDFFGAGIHARLDLKRDITLVPGLSVFGCVDGAVLIGRSRQRFRLESNEGTFLDVDTNTQHEQQTVPVLGLQVGVTYAMPGLPGLKFINGYEYERFFAVADVGPSRGEVYYHGWFMRVRYDF